MYEVIGLLSLSKSDLDNTIGYFEEHKNLTPPFVFYSFHQSEFHVPNKTRWRSSIQNGYETLLTGFWEDDSNMAK